MNEFLPPTFFYPLYEYIGLAMMVVGMALCARLGVAKQLGYRNLAIIGLFLIGQSLCFLGIGLSMKIFGTDFGEWVIWLSDAGLTLGAFLLIIDISFGSRRNKRR